MRVLVFGGSFDPPHVGHAALLAAAKRAIKPDRILVVPAYSAPLKAAPRASAADRLRMIRLGLLFDAKTRLDLHELQSGRRVYTVETLARLKKADPGGALHFVAGSDAAAQFPSWKDPARLRHLAAWWTARRPGGPRPPSFFKLLPGKMPDVSSTEVRRRLALGEPVDGLLAPKVEDYIFKRKLYGLRLLKKLSKELKPGRFEHTLCVAKLADELAGRHGLDRERARLAGLLHDCGRAVPVPRMAAYARARKLDVPRLEAVVAHNPLLLHAFIGEDLARRRHGVKDAEILAAIRNHTLGRPGMGALERLIYVADACSEDRRYPEAAALRARARRDLDAAFKKTVALKRRFVREDGAWAHPLTERLWNSLRKA